MWRQWPRGVCPSAFLLALGCWLITLPVGAAPATPAPAVPGDARAWLLRTHEAASKRNYEGTLVFSTHGAMSSSKVAHFCDGAQQFERVEALDGEPRSMLRQNDLVHTVWPRAQVVVAEHRDVRAAFPSLLSGAERRVLSWYQLQPQGEGRVAGREADVVILRARDALRFSQRLWADRQTGLLLRADILAADGQALESAAFSELAIGVKARPELVTGPLNALAGYRVVRPVTQETTLAGEGWRLSQPPAGFAQVQCLRRSLDPADERTAPTVLQTIFSDGLTHVSLFIEPYQAQRHQTEGGAAVGATHSYSLRRDEVWITVVGDVPTATLKLFVAALERQR
jgi:sigma-E factor negative regulatory protein RseB